MIKSTRHVDRPLGNPNRPKHAGTDANLDQRIVIAGDRPILAADIAATLEQATNPIYQGTSTHIKEKHDSLGAGANICVSIPEFLLLSALLLLYGRNFQSDLIS